MLFCTRNLALAARLLYLLNILSVTASPFVSPDQIFGLEKRQTDTTIGNVATQDETDEEIAADGTGAMRSEYIPDMKDSCSPSAKPLMLDPSISPTRPPPPFIRLTWPPVTLTPPIRVS